MRARTGKSSECGWICQTRQSGGWFSVSASPKVRVIARDRRSRWNEYRRSVRRRPHGAPEYGCRLRLGPSGEGTEHDRLRRASVSPQGVRVVSRRLTNTADSAPLLGVVPTLDRLANHLDQVESLPEAAAKALLLKAAPLVESLRLHAAKHTELVAANSARAFPDKLIGAIGVGELIGRSESWVQKHTSVLPPRRSLVGGPMWLQSEIVEWMRNRPRYGRN